MSEHWDNNAFWNSSETHVTGEMPGLKEWADANEATRGLLYFRTSGSEGIPKWVGISRAAFFASARAVNHHLESVSTDRWLVALPLNHVGGFSILARCFVSGASWLEMEGKWDPAKFTALCATEHVTLTSLVPTQVYDLVQAGIEAPASLRAIVVGGGALSRDIGTKAMELGWPVLQSYGMTETASQVATEPLHHLQTGFDPEMLEVLQGWQLEAEDDGCLTVRGSALASGYATSRDDQWTWQAIDPSRGLRTRDHVRHWWHGTRQFLSFQGRDAAFVKVLGELVNLTALKKRLDESASSLGLAYHEIVIWPLEDARKGTRLVLVGSAETTALESLRSAFNASVAGYEKLDVVQRLSPLPTTALGKIDHAALKHQLSSIV